MPEYEQIKYTGNSSVKVFLNTIEKRLFHWHDELELIYVLDGKVLIGTPSRQFIIEKNQLLVINPQEIHGLSDPDSDNLLLVIQLVTPNNLPYCSHDYNVHYEMQPYYVLDDKNLRVIPTLMIDIMITLLKENNGFAFRLSALISELFYILFNYFPKQDYSFNDSKNKNLHKIQSLLSYINKNFKNKLTMEELAKEVNFSKSYLSHFFKKHLGMNFQTYLKQIRINHAIKLLMNDEKNILDISYECGFSDYQYLNKAFKENYNCTPAQYRANRMEILSKMVPGTSIKSTGEFIHYNKEEMLALLENYYGQYPPIRQYVI
ncbi:MAG: AraC family transcriptional regulator [Saccharofermentanales bacterium]|jgi:xylan 1,4-beta-xylosidase